MNPSSDIVMCETTLPIRYLLPVACMMMNVTDGQSSSVTAASTALAGCYSPTPRTWPTRLAAALLPSRDGLSLLPLHAAPT